jgi:hypothetical protein
VTERFWLDGVGDESNMPENRRSKGINEPLLWDLKVEFLDEGSGDEVSDSYCMLALEKGINHVKLLHVWITPVQEAESALVRLE